MKILRLINRGIRDAFKSVFRNFSLTIAAIFCVLITLLLVSVSIVMSSNVNHFTKQIEQELTIVVFMHKDSTSQDIESLRDKLGSTDNVMNIVFRSKEEIRLQMMEESEIFKETMKDWDEKTNPLKHTFLVKVSDISRIGPTAGVISEYPEVSATQYGEGMAEKLVAVFSIIEKVTIGIVIVLILVSSFLISNTIKITIYSRKTEIDIMRLVGTSNFAIKFPHLVEGFVIGLLGSIIPVIATIYGYIYLYTNNDGIFMLNMFKLIDPYNFVFQISIIIVIIGTFVGMLGSYRAVRKHLTI